MSLTVTEQISRSHSINCSISQFFLLTPKILEAPDVRGEVLVLLIVPVNFTYIITLDKNQVAWINTLIANKTIT